MLIHHHQVDYTRVNEFGQGGDDEEVTDKKASKPLQAPADGEIKALKAKGNGVATSSGKDKGSAKRRKA